MDWPKIAVWGDIARHNAAVFPDKPAFVSGCRALAYAEVNSRINQLNHAFTALGLAPGDRVAVLSRNRTEYFEIYGSAKTVLITVPLNWRLAARELLFTLLDSRPAVIVAEPDFVPTIDAMRPELPGVRHYIVLGEATAAWIAYETMLSGSSVAEPQLAVHPDDALCLIYSSGTTGAPKGAVMTHRRAINTCRAIAEDMLHLTSEDVGLSVMPWFHAGGMWYHLLPSFASGGTTIVLPEFDPCAVLNAIAAHGVTQIHLVPTMISILLDQPEVQSMDLTRLRAIKYAASSIPLRVLKRALQVFKGCGFVQSYGSTEMGAVTALLPEDHIAALKDTSKENLLLSCGRPMPGVKIEIRDGEGRPLDPGEIGEITVQGDRVMVNYWERPELTATALVEGWLYTGDLGYIDGAGYLYIVDRKHDMIVTGGENVFPREVEDILYENPALAEVAVFAIPDPKWVERVAAAVVLKKGHATTAEEVRSRAAKRLAPYKCPKTVLFVDKLPKNASGKILKKELRREYANFLTAAPEK